MINGCVGCGYDHPLRALNLDDESDPYVEYEPCPDCGCVAKMIR